MLRIADREEDEWEDVKYYLSDNLASDSEDEKQLSRASREAAANKKKRDAKKQKDKKKQFQNDLPPPPSEKNPKSLTNHSKDTMLLEITQNIEKFVLPADKNGIFNISVQIEETEATVNLGRDWEISGKTDYISLRGRLKENSHF